MKLVFRVLGNADTLPLWFELRKENLWKVESIRTEAHQLEKCAGDSGKDYYS